MFLLQDYMFITASTSCYQFIKNYAHLQCKSFLESRIFFQYKAYSQDFTVFTFLVPCFCYLLMKMLALFYVSLL